MTFVFDAYRVGYAYYHDYHNGSSRNVVGTTFVVTGKTAGGYSGALGGAAIGSVMFPGIGTVAGGIIGGIAGAITGKLVIKATVNTISDAVEYNIEKIHCEGCNKKFKARKYRGEKHCEDSLKEIRKLGK